MKDIIRQILRENLENKSKNTKSVLKDMGYTIGANGLVEKDGVKVILLLNKVYEVVDGTKTVYDAFPGENVDIIELISNEGKIKGMASKVLDDIINVSDSLGRTLQLFPQQMNSGELDYDQLKNWYERKGFMMNDEGIMVRVPN